jgi:hypothetical protein
MVDVCAFTNPVSPTNIRISSVAACFFIIILFSPVVKYCGGAPSELLAKAKPHASI